MLERIGGEDRPRHRYCAAVSFLNLALLGGLAAVAVPIIIHLLNRRSAKRVDWGAMRFLLDSLLSRKKRIQLEEALLMAARCLLVALLALCVARPLADAGSNVPWVAVLPLFLLGVALAAVTTVMWPERHLRWKLLAATAALLGLAGAAVAAERWLNLKRFGTTGRKDIALVIDGSMSMTLAPGGGTANFDAAVKEAEKIVTDAGGGTSFSLILGAPVPQAVIGQPLVNRAEVRAALSALRPVNGRMAAFDALSLATISLAQGNNPQKEIIVLTDAQDIGWELDRPARWESLQQGFANLKSPPRLIVRQFPLPASVRNLAVSDVRFSRQVIGTDRPVTIEVPVTNTGAESVTPAAVELTIGETTLTDTSLGQLLPGSTESVKFSHTFAEPGGHILTATVKVEDDLPGDNSWASVAEVRSRVRVLIVDGSPGGPFLERAGSLAALALAPGSLLKSSDPAGGEAVADLIDPEVKAVAALAGVDGFSEFDAVILCDVAGLAPSQARLLAGFVEAGGGLLVAPGVRANPAFYNGWQSAGGVPVMPTRLVRQVVVPADGSEVKPALTTFSHPAVRLVADAKQSDLGSLVLSRYWSLADNAALEPAVTIGARLATGEPLLTARQLGQGTVLALATSLDPNGSNLPSRQAFVALMHEIVHHLVDPGGQRLNRQPAYVVNVPLTRTRATSGLQAEYFQRSTPDAVLVSRIDPQHNFQWGQASPAPGLGPDNFGARWSGALVAKVTGEYFFHLEADDSADLTVNGQAVFESNARKRERIGLVAGQPVPITATFREGGGQARFRVEWESDQVPRQVIPTESFMPYLPGEASETHETSMGSFAAVGPDQLPRQVEIVRTPAGSLARLSDTVIPGLFQVTLPDSVRTGLQDVLTPQGTLAFTVVPDSGEGAIRPLTDEAFAFFNRYAPTVRPTSAQQVLDVLAGRQFGEELWKYLAVGALFLLLAEIALTRWIAKQRQSGAETTIDLESRFQPGQSFTSTVEKLRKAA
jgi:hypothetical protein